MSEVVSQETGAEVAPEIQDESQEVQKETTGQDEQEQDQEGQKQPRDDKGRWVPQERVNEITRARREAERGLQQAAYERDQERQARAQLEARLRQYEQPAQSADRVPTLEDFNFDPAAYQRALSEWNASRVDRVVDERLRQMDYARQQQQVANTFSQRIATYAVDHPEIAERVHYLDSVVTFPEAINLAIAQNEHGPAIVDYLAQHLDVADQIQRSPIPVAAMLIGRLEAELSSKPAGQTTKAPKPTPKVGGGGSPSRNPDDMTSSEWLAWRNNQLKK